MTKQELRTNIKTKQKLFFAKETSAASMPIHKSYNLCKKISNTPQFQKAEIIFAFMPLNDEVNIGGVITEAFLNNKKVAVPVIKNDNELMEFHWIDSATKMTPGAFGIYEPSENPVDMTSIQNSLILLPGLAFTESGKRLGRGKGFYDRFLSKYKNQFTKIGVCFDFQICPEEGFPSDQNDIPADLVLFA